MTWVSIGTTAGTAILGAASGSKDKKRSDRLAMESEATERMRDQRIAGARGQIDAVFDSGRRTQQRRDFATNLRGYLDSQLQRQRMDTGRNLKFALAKQGLTGGSVDIDKNRRLGDEFAEAAIGNERTVAGELSQLTAQDEQQRNALKAMASQGMTLGEASRRAGTAAQQNLATADTRARVQGIGDVFADTAATYKGINERAAMRQGYGYNNRRSDLYGGRT